MRIPQLLGSLVILGAVVTATQIVGALPPGENAFDYVVVGGGEVPARDRRNRTHAVLQASLV